MYSVTNVTQSVPDSVRDIFFGCLPFGSDYVMYCDRNDASRVSYTCLFRRVGSDVLSRAVCYRNSGSSDWVFSSEVTSTDYSGISVSNPYYCYSNIEGQGRYTVSPSGQNLVVLLLIVLASLAVLKFVFGGVSLWRGRSEPY